MSRITVDITMPSGLDLTRSEIRRKLNMGIRDMGTRAFHFWQGLAKDELNSTYSEYVGSMELSFVPAAAGLDAAFIGIHGFLPMAVELGAEPYDMKSRLYGSSSSQGELFSGPKTKVKTGKNGMRYAIVPMRQNKQQGAPVHLAPAPLQRSRGTSSKYKALNNIIGRKPEIQRQPQANMQRFGGLYTFRKMTSNSQQQSWRHPGFDAKMLHERVIDHIERTLMPEIFEPLFASLMG